VLTATRLDRVELDSALEVARPATSGDRVEVIDGRVANALARSANHQQRKQCKHRDEHCDLQRAFEPAFDGMALHADSPFAQDVEHNVAA